MRIADLPPQSQNRVRQNLRRATDNPASQMQIIRDQLQELYFEGFGVDDVAVLLLAEFNITENEIRRSLTTLIATRGVRSR